MNEPLIGESTPFLSGGGFLGGSCDMRLSEGPRESVGRRPIEKVGFSEKSPPSGAQLSRSNGNFLTGYGRRMLHGSRVRIFSVDKEVSHSGLGWSNFKYSSFMFFNSIKCICFLI